MYTRSIFIPQSMVHNVSKAKAACRQAVKPLASQTGPPCLPSRRSLVAKLEPHEIRITYYAGLSPLQVGTVLSGTSSFLCSLTLLGFRV